MKTPLFSLLFLLNFIGFCQSNSDYTNYNQLKEENKKLLFIENFDNNKNEWLLGIKENVWRQTIDSGYLYFEAYENKAKEDYIKLPIDQTKNFEIEVRMKFNGGDNTKANGLQWGKSINTNYQFDFLFSGNGQYTIDKFTGSFHDFVPFTVSPLIRKDDFNTLTIRKISNTYFFFINKEFVYKTPFEPFFGDYIGIQVGELSQLLTDYITIYEIVPEKIVHTCKLEITDYDFFSRNGIAEPGKPIHFIMNVKNNSDVPAIGIAIDFSLPKGANVINNGFKTIELQAQETKELELIFTLDKLAGTEKCEVKLSASDFITNEEKFTFEFELNKALPSKANEFVTGDKIVYRGDPLKGLNVNVSQQAIEVGNYYALIIGIDNYSGSWEKLSNAVADAKSVETTLKSKYKFDVFKILLNEQATRQSILTEMEWLMANVKENDNVFIYYSGHGDFNKELNKGFWVPADATTNSIANFISNDDIRTFLSGIKSKHTLLVADACFSGDILRGQTVTIPFDDSDKYYNKVYSIPSRKAMASGGIEPVMDGGKEGHSVFAFYFLKALNNNTSKYFDSSQLFEAIKIPVVNNSNQTPGFSPIKDTGDEGGQFVFIKK